MIRTMKQIMNNKKVVLLAIVCSIMVLFTGYGSTQDKVESIAKEHAELFTSGKMEDINQIIFGVSGLQEEIGKVEVQGGNMISNEGILGIIFTHCTVSVEKVTEDSVKLKISAPDMSDLFFYLRKASVSFHISLTEYVNAYVNKAEMKENCVSVSYVVKEEEVIIDYCNEEFINAITGGLFEAYKEAWIDEMNEYTEEVNE